MDYQNKYDTVFNATFSKKEAFFKEQLYIKKIPEILKKLKNL